MRNDLFETAITDPQDALRFVYAGRALFTITSRKTGTRFTFKVSAAHGERDKSKMRFVKVLNGPDNTSSYLYLGYVKTNQPGEMFAGNKGRPDAASYKALSWTLKQLAAGRMPEDLEFLHAGKCGCCGRALTVPESIKTGLGPVCAGKE